jgi:hypothetical protein
MQALLETPMTKRNDVSVKMDAQVVEDCRIAASFRKMTLAEYLSETMREAAKRDIDEGYAQRAAAQAKPQAPPKPEGPRRPK